MPKVMIVDDDEFLHRVMTRILSLGGYEVTAHAYNGREAVDMYKAMNDKPDVILMDHRMPIMSGTQATQEILRYNPKAKILFVSADESAMAEAIALGAAGFLIKPVRSTNLFSTLEKLFGGS
ncbi:MAG: response regulator [Candidatus Thorarchaeota archaeon]